MSPQCGDLSTSPKARQSLVEPRRFEVRCGFVGSSAPPFRERGFGHLAAAPVGPSEHGVRTPGSIAAMLAAQSLFSLSVDNLRLRWSSARTYETRALISST